MSDQLIDAFDECTTALLEGTSLEDCLARYPQFAEELRPMLLAAADARHYIHSMEIPPQAQSASRAKYMEAINQARQADQPRRKRIHLSLSFLSTRIAIISAGIVLSIILGTYGVVSASANSQPGDLLYGVKRTAERTRLLFSTSHEDHALQEAQIAQHRAEEAHKITMQARTASIEFGGPLESLKGELGVVAGMPVTIAHDTQILGEPEIGLYVWVIGRSQPDRTIRAATIRVEGARIQGEVISMHKPGWQVNGSAVIVSKLTHIVGNPGVGDQVEVNVRILSDGQLLAEEITLMTTGRDSMDTFEQPLAATATPTPRSLELPTTPTATAVTPEPKPGDAHKQETTPTPIPNRHQTHAGTHSIPPGQPTEDRHKDRHGTPWPTMDQHERTRTPDHHRPRSNFPRR